MNKTLLLTIRQATVLHKAMRDLDEIDGTLIATSCGITVVELNNGAVSVMQDSEGEHYATRAAFVTAYGLDL